MVPTEDRRQQGVQRGGGHLVARQGTQVIIPALRDPGARGQRPHFAIPDVGLPTDPDGSLHPLNLRHIQGVIRTVPADDRHRQGQPQGIERRQIHLDLRQVRPVIFTMPELKQAVLVDRGVGLGRGAVNADRRRRLAQIINPQDHPVERRFDLGPRVGLRQPIQQVSQPIIAEVQRANRLTPLVTS